MISYLRICNAHFCDELVAVSNICYVIDAFLYWSAWFNKRVLTVEKRALTLWWADTYFWVSE